MSDYIQQRKAAEHAGKTIKALKISNANLRSERDKALENAKQAGAAALQYGAEVDEKRRHIVRLSQELLELRRLLVFRDQTVKDMDSIREELRLANLLITNAVTVLTGINGSTR